MIQIELIARDIMVYTDGRPGQIITEIIIQILGNTLFSITALLLVTTILERSGILTHGTPFVKLQWLCVTLRVHKVASLCLYNLLITLKFIPSEAALLNSVVRNPG